MRFMLIWLMVLISLAGNSQNILQIQGAFSRPGDTVTLHLDIDNADPFISFQFDIRVPEGTSYLPESALLSSRKQNHVVLSNVIGDTLRIAAWSPDNSPFFGHEGEVLVFRLIIGNIRGEYPLAPSHAIIGDSLSQNILTDVESGILSVFPLSLDDDASEEGNLLLVCPNPADDRIICSYRLDQPTRSRIELIDIRGRTWLASETTEQNPGICSTQLTCAGIPEGEYLIGLCLWTSDKKTRIYLRKIVICHL